jgi:hypothetical protein
LAASLKKNYASEFEVPSSSSDCSKISETLPFLNKLIHQKPYDPIMYEGLSKEEVGNKMKQLKIRWCQEPNCEGCQRQAIGHTERTNTTRIFLNSSLKKLCKGDSLSAMRTQFLMAVTIYHEIGHLLLRWQHINVTPSKFRGRLQNVEAGEYCEMRALDGVVHAEVVCHKSFSSQRKPRSKYRTDLLSLLYFIILFWFCVCRNQVLKLDDVELVEGILLRSFNSNVIRRFSDDFIGCLMNPESTSNVDDILDDVKTKPWKRTKGNRCFKAGSDEEQELPQRSFELPPGHFIFEPGEKL